MHNDSPPRRTLTFAAPNTRVAHRLLFTPNVPSNLISRATYCSNSGYEAKIRKHKNPRAGAKANES